ncbi:MAG: protein kinase, partial [Candidatus Eisenbacteria bacterium]
GPYEILSPLGAGGMGEVFRARDTRLQRDVAIKVVPDLLAGEPEVRARFEREARAASALNHPHICQVYDVGREGDVDYIVMELIEGESLAQRLERGAMPSAEVLRVSSQIADALDRAHRAGIVHRDLKPGNIMLTKQGAKLVDFGLARPTGLGGPGTGSRAGTPSSPTISRPLTAAGSIVGTFMYMAPEQLEGNEADARSDIWALGATMYEMATGLPAFEGKSQASLIASILSKEPRPISEVVPLSPPALERLVKACLAKEPDERVQTAHDVKLQLKWITEGGSQAGVPAPVSAQRRKREGLAWSLFGVTAVVAVALAALLLQPKPKPNSVIFELIPPHQVGSVDLPRISPDGRRLAFNATDSTGAASIWVRSMNSLDAQRLPGTEGATRPFWSPDSRYLAFFSGGKLRKIDTAGGPPQIICDAPRGADGSWGAKNVILFDGTASDSVQRVSAGGGEPSGATVIDRAKHETFTAWPQFLPDGNHFLYLAYTGDERVLKVGSLDSKDVKSLGPVTSRTEYALGHLLFVRLGVLLAQPFDARAIKFTGDPFPVADGVEYDVIGSARFSASTQGTLVYRAGGGGASGRLVWVDRTGRRVGTIGASGFYADPMLSPDDTQLAVKLVTPGRADGDIWIWDLSRDLGSRFTFASSGVENAVWSPDGSRIIYSQVRENANDLHIKPIGGAGTDSVLLANHGQNFADDWSSDGRYLSFIARSPDTNRRWDIFVMEFGDSTRVIPVVTTPLNEYGTRFTPDGRWIAYTSWESGQSEVYLQAFPGPGSKARVSTHGGAEPMWRGDGRELYYLSPARELMAVSFEAGPMPHLGLPQKLFDTSVVTSSETRNRYCPTRDGQKFVLNITEGEAKVGATTVVLDWLGSLQKGTR